MTDAVSILAMHPEMQTLFPTPPKRWRWIEAGNDIEATINERGGDVEILLSASIEKLDKGMLSGFPKLRMIASISAGFSNVDLEECRARGIAVTNAPGLNSGDVADLAVTMLTSLLLGIPKSQNYILEDRWTSPAGPLRFSLRHMPVGIGGWGSIGQEIDRRLFPSASISNGGGHERSQMPTYPMLRRYQISLISAAA